MVSGLLRRNDFLLAYIFAKNYLKVKYRRHFLGFLWSLLNPILSMVVISAVFSKVMGMRLVDFVPFLFSGLLPYTLFGNSVTGGSESLINNEGIIKNSNVSKMVFPLSSVISATFEFTFGLISLLIVIHLIFLFKPTIYLLYIVPATFFLVIFSLGLALIFSILVSRFRDFSHIISLVIQISFYVTPILYPKSRLENYQYINDLNPLTSFIGIFRDAAYYHTHPTLRDLSVCIILSFVTLLIGIFVFNKYEDKVYYYL